MKDLFQSRRQFLKASGAVATAAPVSAAFGLQLAAFGSATSQTTASGYKAIVCIFQFGGNDSHNTVLATDDDSWKRYWSARNLGVDPIALMPVGTKPVAYGQTSPLTKLVSESNRPEAWGGVLPITTKTAQKVPAGTNASARTFGLHPMMKPLLPAYNAGRLAIVANVGTLVEPITKAEYIAGSKRTPLSLFSHNDQTATWQAGLTEGVRTGWGGRFGDLLASQNGANSVFTAMSTSGNSVFLAGQSIIQYQVSTRATPAQVFTSTARSTLFGSKVGVAKVIESVGDIAFPANLGSDYNQVVRRSMESATILNSAALSAVVEAVPEPPIFTNPITNLAESNTLSIQLQTVARMIAAAPALGIKRQVFFVGMGGHDTHDQQNSRQPVNLLKLAEAMATFDATLANIGGVDMRSAVTTFTASDFSRTFQTNGDGTDHAWGGHHFVMGGAVKGGTMYGQFPTIGLDLNGFDNPDLVKGASIPTTSVDQYAATIGRWFGVSTSDLGVIFPNLRNFSAPDLGFMR